MDEQGVGNAAADYFAEGWYCAESVFLALSSALGHEKNCPPALASGLCAGFSRSGGPCGALSGAIVGLGLLQGRQDARDKCETIYRSTQTLIQRFIQEFGASDCPTLLGCDLNSEAGREYFQQQGLRQKRCAVYTESAARMAAQILAQSFQADP